MSDPQWMLDEAQRIKQARRLHLIEDVLAVLVVMLIAIMILIVIGWVR